MKVSQLIEGLQPNMRPGRTSRTRQGVAPGVRSQIFEPLFSNQIWLGTKAMSKTLSGLVRSFPKFQTVAQTQGIRILTYWSVALFFDVLVQLGAVEDTAKWLRYIMWFIILSLCLGQMICSAATGVQCGTNSRAELHNKRGNLNFHLDEMFLWWCSWETGPDMISTSF